MKFSFVDPVNNKALVLPVPPERMQVKIGTKLLVYDPIALGTIELPRGRLPIKFTLEGMLPGNLQTAIPNRENDLPPNEVIRVIREWSEAKGSTGKKLRFIVTDSDWNIPIFLSTFEPSEPNGFGDIRYTLSLTEFRDFTVKEVKPNTPSKKSSRDTKPKPKTYTVKKGDTLWSIARRFTGAGIKWTALWNLNKGKLRSGNPDRIYVGEVLTIPPGWLK
ncbi:LysM peptidoglycan-binding domain-containing protein [Sporosarcina sp. ITBMC105]